MDTGKKRGRPRIERDPELNLVSIGARLPAYQVRYLDERAEGSRTANLRELIDAAMAEDQDRQARPWRYAPGTPVG